MLISGTSAQVTFFTQQKM